MIPGHEHATPTMANIVGDSRLENQNFSVTNESFEAQDGKLPDKLDVAGEPTNAPTILIQDY